MSTIGAGDNFNAGFLFGLIKENVTHQDVVSGLKEEQWDSIISYGQRFAAEACNSLYNYVSTEFAAE